MSGVSSVDRNGRTRTAANCQCGLKIWMYPAGWVDSDGERGDSQHRHQPTYRVVRNIGHDKPETVEATGLNLGEARALEAKLQQAYRAANPGKSSWTSDLYLVQMEA